nr:ribonuclease H-like domain-containing protein [Tanacetum cinerariifolium]
MLKDVFHDNKSAKAMQLDNDLRNIKLGNLIITEYFHKINRLADLLENIDAPVDKKICRLVRKSNHLSTRDSTSSLPHVLLAATSNNRNNSTGTQLCRNLQRGSCNFGERCKYVHTNPTSNARNENENNRGSASQMNNTTGRIMHGARVTFSPTKPSKMGYVTGPGSVSSLSQPITNWTSPPTLYYNTATTIVCNGVLDLAPRQVHVRQPAGHAVFGPSGPCTYTTCTLHGTWGPQVVYGPYVDQETTLPQALNAMTVQDYGDSGWYMDTEATSHLASNTGKLTTISNNSNISSILVINGNSIPVINSGHSMLPNPNRPLHLHNVLVTPSIIKNLIYVHQFTRDNAYSIEFDPFGFSVKNLWTWHLLLRCNSTGDLYLILPSNSSPTALLSMVIHQIQPS